MGDVFLVWMLGNLVGDAILVWMLRSLVGWCDFGVNAVDSTEVKYSITDETVPVEKAIES